MPVHDKPVIIKGQFQMSTRSEVNAQAIIILHFVLKGINADGSPARILKEALSRYHICGVSLFYKEVVFDVSNEKLYKEYIGQIQPVVQKLQL